MSAAQPFLPPRAEVPAIELATIERFWLRRWLRDRRRYAIGTYGRRNAVKEARRRIARIRLLVPSSHRLERHCAPTMQGALCIVCGVTHAEACGSCGRRGYHRVGCPEIDAPASARPPSRLADVVQLATRDSLDTGRRFKASMRVAARAVRS